MIINKFDIIRGTILETKNDPPVCPNRNAPKAFHIADKGMQLVIRQVHIHRLVGGFEKRKKFLKTWNKVRPNSAPVTLFVQSLEALVFETFDQCRTILSNHV